MVWTGAGLDCLYGISGDTAPYSRYFGVGLKVSTFGEKWQVESAFGLGRRTFVDVYSKGFDGDFSVEFLLTDTSDFSWICAGIGTDTDANGYTIISELDPITVDMYYPYSHLGADGVTTYPYYITRLSGIKFNSVKFSYESGEVVKVSLDGKYASFDKIDANDPPSVTLGIPLTFAHTTFTSGNTYGTVKSFDVEINNNLETIRTLGNVYPVEFREQKAEISGTMTLYLEEGTYDHMFKTTRNASYVEGDTSITLTSANGNTIEVVLENVKFDEISHTPEEANVVEVSVRYVAEKVKFKVTPPV